MIPVVAVQGTWGRRDPWWQDGSAFWSYMAPYGLVPARVSIRPSDPNYPPVPFEWETNLGSSLMFWRRWGWGQRGVETWEYAGKALAYYLGGLPYDQRVVVAHSHGGQVAIHAAAYGRRIKRLLTVGTPYRADMIGATELARESIETWWHVMDEDCDFVATWGRLGDGAVGGGRRLPAADANLRLPGIGHSELFTNESVFWQWRDTGLITFLGGRHGEDETAPLHTPPDSRPAGAIDACPPAAD